MNQLFYMVLYAYVPISYLNCDLILFMFPYINSKMYKKILPIGIMVKTSRENNWFSLKWKKEKKKIKCAMWPLLVLSRYVIRQCNSGQDSSFIF